MDIVLISRVEKWVQDAAMLEEIFTGSERAYCLERRRPERHLAMFFAAKEAFLKAIGTGWGFGVGWKDMELYVKEGVFSIKLYNKAAELCSGTRVFVAADSAGDFASAMVAVDYGE